VNSGEINNGDVYTAPGTNGEKMENKNETNENIRN